MTEVSSTRLYLGNLPRNATKADVEAHFATHGTGEITEIKLMNGFGFIEYKDAMDARDVVPAFHGSDFMGERLTVQFARGTRHREGGNGGGAFNNERAPPRPRRTPHRMQITGLPTDTSWQVCSFSPHSLKLDHLDSLLLVARGALGSSPALEMDYQALSGFSSSSSCHSTGPDRAAMMSPDLKDFARQSSLDVVYSETGRDGNGRGFVEFETAADLRTAVEKLDGREFKGNRVTCVADTQPDVPPRELRGARSRSPGGRRPYPLPIDDYDRRGPPRGYSPRRDGYRDGYRERSPRREYYEDRARYRSPPRRPIDDYPPPRGRYDDPYRRDYPPPPDPYANGRPYDRTPRDFPPPRDGAYPRDAYPREYDRGGRYW
ncbi:Pre-mRNA-splicing factor srp2 [Colletotrichum musicola]|uniref:Pre-mRNA-splicing factor srp2 n=1 Tax=Colletotrichum musicola TaxID=2175873 RepID=A0A8H6KKV4_9PEZI|nr:Pre-mRNA-splicing factor srp2 [Colletotrichum musicola]